MIFSATRKHRELEKSSPHVRCSGAKPYAVTNHLRAPRQSMYRLSRLPPIKATVDGMVLFRTKRPTPHLRVPRAIGLLIKKLVAQKQDSKRQQMEWRTTQCIARCRLYRYLLVYASLLLWVPYRSLHTHQQSPLRPGRLHARHKAAA